MKEAGRVVFTVSKVDCIACTPLFRRELSVLEGVKKVDQLSMLNRVVVEFSPEKVSRERVQEAVLVVAARSGLSGRVVFVK
jgi:copper chaperone CopZ